MMTSTTTVVRWKLCHDGEYRRFSLEMGNPTKPTETDVKTLYEKVLEFYPDFQGKLAWKDEEGDLITFSTANELREAYYLEREQNQDSAVLRLFTVQQRKRQKRPGLPQTENDTDIVAFRETVALLQDFGKQLQITLNKMEDKGTPTKKKVPEKQEQNSDDKTQARIIGNRNQDMGNEGKADEQPMLHPDPLIHYALETLMRMGYTDEGGWLSRLLESQAGNIPATLQLIDPTLLNLRNSQQPEEGSGNGCEEDEGDGYVTIHHQDPCFSGGYPGSRIRRAYHQDPLISSAVKSMIDMGYTNRNNTLVKLMERTDGNIADAVAHLEATRSS